MARTRVLFVHHREDLGGAPRSLAELIEHLDSRFEPHVYVPPGRSAELFARAGAEVHTGPVAIFGHSWDNPYAGARWLLLGRETARLPGHLLRFESLLRRIRPPVVHLNEAQLLAAAALAKRAGAKVVWHLRSSLATSGPRRRHLVTGAVDRYGDAVIAIDDDVASSFPVRRSIDVVFNGVPIPARAAPRTATGSDCLTVGFVGHLRRIKGWEDLLQALALLRDEPVRVAFIGGGVRPPAFFDTPRGRALASLGLLEDDETAARSLAVALRISDRVTFLPYAAELDEVYRALDVVAFPNRGAGLGRAVLEGAAYGRPAVVSGSPSGGGVVLPGTTGLVVSPRSPERLAEAIRSLLDPGFRTSLGDAARAHAAEHFAAASSARAVASIYDRVLG